MSCQISQVMVRRRLEPAKLEEEKKKRLVEAKEELRSFAESETCKDKNKIKESMRSLPNKDKFPKEQIEEMNRLVSAMLKLCDDPSEKNLRVMVDIQLDLDSKTCSIWTNMYEQKFELQPNGQWVNKDGPYGECGFINISVLEQEKGRTLGFWTYKSRKIITNPDANWLLGKCKEFDQKEYTYAWEDGELYRNCGYIKFGF